MDNMTKNYSVTPPGLMMRPNDWDSHNGHSHGREDIDNMPIGMAYVPRQVWRNIYDSGKGIMRGTIFEELDLPFKGAGHR